MTNLDLRSASSAMDRLDPELRLAIQAAPLGKRAEIGTLWALDLHFGTVLAAGNQLIITQMKLAWWREALSALDRGPAPAEPLLEQVQHHLVPQGLSGARLGEMTHGWEHLLVEELTEEDLEAYARLRGGLLFSLSAELLGAAANESVSSAGAAWALADLARHSRRAEERSRAAALARKHLHPISSWPGRLRPLGMRAVLARRDLKAALPERQGAPGRLWRMLAYRLFGR